MSKKVGLIGFGTIGKYLFDQLSNDGVVFSFVYDPFFIANQPEGKDPAIFISSPEVMLQRCSEGVDLVIEAATSQAVVDFGPKILQYTDMVVFSSTALADPDFQQQIESQSQAYGTKFVVPHGAILGLDGLFDGREVLENVTITTTKRPLNLGRTDTSRTTLYEGPTRGACKAFPRNVNVHAGIALAGLGFDKTISKIVSDPESPGNSHLIEIRAKGCWFKIEVMSDPGSGVTGAYTPVSALSTIRRLLFTSGIVIA
ncbi:aspartate dehydrogenase domain-containing protein [Propionivibrio dicarboxylicus]|uniref:Aspartate dehydrogenase n=1 Tax=Propionivibrio dicarboxylicus TaxID=83767 RepID=A0A1G7Z3N3_9RHOO|nr:aspartate dehydrogenase domain-containing protein [Propionivibrio dicarboxylicus]SDH03199.1 aspartate dehydrogenase [Propionivibrio dicarboxylicus]